MKTLTAILAVTFLATAATIAYAGDPIPGVDVNLGSHHERNGNLQITPMTKGATGSLTQSGHRHNANGCNVGVRFTPTTGRCVDGRHIDHHNAIRAVPEGGAAGAKKSINWGDGQRSRHKR